MQNIYSWFEEFSNIKQLNEQDTHLHNITKIPKRSSMVINIDQTDSSTRIHQISPTHEYYSNKTLNDNQLNLIDFGEIAIEDKLFDIFTLENKVGKENTLTVIGTYIFMEQGLYSCVNYQSFENFLKEIAKGYIRDNPYHTVNITLIILKYRIYTEQM